MKMQPAHYAHILNAIAAIPRDKAAAHKEALKSEPRVKDQAKRFRWDLFWATRQESKIIQDLYQYLNDTHIDTALKSIVRELEF